MKIPARISSSFGMLESRQRDGLKKHNKWKLSVLTATVILHNIWKREEVLGQFLPSRGQMMSMPKHKNV
jgi:hypothetical protein